MKKVTVSDVQDYLNQFNGDDEVVLNLDDFGADASEEQIDNAVSLTTMMEEFRDQE